MTTHTRGLAVIVFAAFTTAAAPAASPTAAPAQSDNLAATTCRIDLQATRIAGEPNAVTVRLRSVPHPGVTITAYGATTQWSAPIGAYATAYTGRGEDKEYSFVVRAGGPIEALLYQRASPPCTTRAAVRDRNGYDGPDVERPTLALGDPKPLEPINCAQRYAPATTLDAFEPKYPPMAEQQQITGVVLVLVSIDEFGKPTRALIQSSPSRLLNPASIDAALRSTFSPEIFRCHTVPGDYVFGVFWR
ncbi:MAG TPA: energy transducer TonB [Candidatus Elarobacter sp.]|nr:energy transducer TonB [Candidatus Elarobacter sp.]